MPWLAVFAMAACTPTEAAKSPAEDPQSHLPPGRVDLPAPIPLEGSMPPETHADGKLRVDGLLARREKYFGQKILVRGYLVEKYECPKDATRCEHPHGFLADTPAGGDKRLMLVNIDERIRDALEVGKDYVVTGQFAQRSPDGFVASTGLIMFEGAEGLELPPEKKKNR